MEREDEARLVAVIREAEALTSGEIRVHLSKKSNEDVYAAAVHVFEKMGMTKTKDRNGILFYLALTSHQFAIIGDKGINEKVPSDFWQTIRDRVQEDFRRGDFVSGLATGVKLCGEQLARYFPRQKDDKNELSDEIDFS